MEQKKKIRITIIILAILLGLSLLALGGTLVYNKLANDTSATVIVPDNLITPDEDAGNSESGNSQVSESSSQMTDGSTEKSNRSAGSTSSAVTPAQNMTSEPKQAAAIGLYKKQPEENKAFAVGNMFPGDSETRYYRVWVSYHDNITVHYRAVVRPGYEKLAEVMKIRVKLLSTGETMYEGLMQDMPEILVHRSSPGKSANDELYYEITAYLDTSVGNDYQDKDLVADFKWWVEETENLDSPRTGDASNIMLWTGLAACSCGVLILLLVIRRRKEDETDV